jgi:hypothetical protein
LPHLGAAVQELTGEGDDFANDELGDRAGVGEGGVEDRDTVLGGVDKVDLVGADAEAADGAELRVSSGCLRARQQAHLRVCVNNPSGDLGLAPDTDSVVFCQTLDELLL